MTALPGVLKDLPSTLKLGFANWTVEVVEEGSIKSNSEGMNCLGICESETFQIKISQGQNDLHAKNTFIHELLHAIYFVQGLSDDVDEEIAVTALANGLQAALQDNPGLQVWWVNHLCGDVEYE